MADWDDPVDLPDLVIPAHLVEKASQIVRTRHRDVGEAGMLEICHRLQWYDCPSYSPEGKLVLAGLDGLHVVALAAAMVAYAAAKGTGR